MLKHGLISCLAGFAVALLALPASAQETATIVTRDGQRQTGELVDLSSRGFTMRVDGRYVDIPREDVAALDFGDGFSSDTALDADHAIVVLRSGEVVEGRLTDIGGTQPLRISLDTGRGYRDYSSTDIAHIYFLNAAPGANGFNDVRPAANYRTDTTGARPVVVRADQDWTPTGIQVERGERLAFVARGRVGLGNDKYASPDGNSAASAPGNRYPANAPIGTLIGRIDNGAPFVIGASDSSVIMPATGELQLGVNDDHFADNNGSFEVEVR